MAAMGSYTKPDENSPEDEICKQKQALNQALDEQEIFFHKQRNQIREQKNLIDQSCVGRTSVDDQSQVRISHEMEGVNHHTL